MLHSKERGLFEVNDRRAYAFNKYRAILALLKCKYLHGGVGGEGGKEIVAGIQISSVV